MCKSCQENLQRFVILAHCVACEVAEDGNLRAGRCYSEGEDRLSCTCCPAEALDCMELVQFPYGTLRVLVMSEAIASLCL